MTKFIVDRAILRPLHHDLHSRKKFNGTKPVSFFPKTLLPRPQEFSVLGVALDVPQAFHEHPALLNSELYLLARNQVYFTIPCSVLLLMQRRRWIDPAELELDFEAAQKLSEDDFRATTTIALKMLGKAKRDSNSLGEYEYASMFDKAIDEVKQKITEKELDAATRKAQKEFDDRDHGCVPSERPTLETVKEQIANELNMVLRRLMGLYPLTIGRCSLRLTPKDKFEAVLVPSAKAAKINTPITVGCRVHGILWKPL